MRGKNRTCCGGSTKPKLVIPADTPQIATGIQPAVVFVFYRNPASANPIPIERLDDHFRWNEATYRVGSARVYVVTDQPYPVPPYARCVVYPEPMPIFSLTKCKNLGITAALRDGRDPIIVTDVDIAFTPEAWGRMLAVTEKQALIATYWLAAGYEIRNDLCLQRGVRWHVSECRKSHKDYGAGGTICMQAINWQKIKWEERCVGYGSDDGIIRKDIEAAGLEVIGHSRSQHEAPVFHIAHSPLAPQANFADNDSNRTDRWSPDFNKLNFQENRRLYLGRQR